MSFPLGLFLSCARHFGMSLKKVEAAVAQLGHWIGVNDLTKADVQMVMLAIEGLQRGEPVAGHQEKDILAIEERTRIGLELVVDEGLAVERRVGQPAVGQKGEGNFLGVGM